MGILPMHRPRVERPRHGLTMGVVFIELLVERVAQYAIACRRFALGAATHGASHS